MTEAYPWARAARLSGRQLLARRSHETREEIHKRAVAKRDARAAVLYGDPARDHLLARLEVLIEQSRRLTATTAEQAEYASYRAATISACTASENPPGKGTSDAA